MNALVTLPIVTSAFGGPDTEQAAHAVHGQSLIPISRPAIGPAEMAAVQTVLESGQLAQGRWVAEFEDAFAAFCGAQHAIAISNGTTALHLALLGHGIGPGDEVITTAFTFIASSNVILYVGARPVFADIEPDTFNIDPDHVERLITPQTKAVLPVDLYGHPADLPRLRSICDKHGLQLIEDASQAHGASIAGRRTGSTGTATFSFYATKNMTTAEGGMITTDNAHVAQVIRRLRSHGSQGVYEHVDMGFNYRMTNISAALGIEQLKRLPELNARRAANAAYLTQNLPKLLTPTTRGDVRHVFHQYTLRIPSGRDEFAAELRKRGIESRVYYPLAVHQQPIYQKLGYGGASLPETERAALEVLSIPVYPGLSQHDLERVARSMSEVWFAVG